jgi:hypothetical protein
MYPPTFSRGASDTAKALERDLASMFAKPDVHELREKIVVAMSTSRIPVQLGTLERAFSFASTVPLEMSNPDVVVEENGEIAFDWQDTKDLVLSVVVKNSGYIGYAALLGTEPVYGRVPFTGSLPETVAHLMARFYAARSKPHRAA